MSVVLKSLTFTALTSRSSIIAEGRLDRLSRGIKFAMVVAVTTLPPAKSSRNLTHEYL